VRWRKAFGLPKNDRDRRVPQVLASTEAPALDGRSTYDSEGGMFCATGPSEARWKVLPVGVGAVAAVPERMGS
jgi:hypothetical protein